MASLLPVLAWCFLALNTLGSIMFMGPYVTRNNFDHEARVQDLANNGFDAPQWGGTFLRDKQFRFQEEGGAYSCCFAVHVTLCVAWYLLSPLQLLGPQKWPQLHRWNGRLQFAVAMANSVSGATVLAKHAGLFMEWSCYVFGPLCFGTAFLSWKAAREKQFLKHRILAQRLVGYMTAVPFARLTWAPFVVYHLGAEDMFSETPPDGMAVEEVNDILSRYFDLTFPVACVFCIGLTEFYLWLVEIEPILQGRIKSNKSKSD